MTVARQAATVAVATVGLGLNLRAWMLLGPRLAQRTDVGLREYVLLMGVPLVVAAVTRVPAGVLTDRYGARAVFPAVSLVAAGSVVWLDFAGTVPAIVLAGGAAGIGGTAFVAGAAQVSRNVGYGRRGLALGVFGTAPAVAVLISAVSWVLDPHGRRAAVVLGAVLIGFAALAAVVLPAHTGTTRAAALVPRCLDLVRLASATSLTVLYALALGGFMAVAVYLPAYLATMYGLPWIDGLAVTGAVVCLAAVARSAGGWWTDRRPTARLVMVCYTTAAGLCLVLAFAPRVWWLTAPLIGGVAVCDGAASGALLALIGKAARADSVGAVMGVTGAAAAVGALLLSLLLAGVDRLTGSYATGWLLLAGVLTVVARYVRAHGLRIALGLAVRADPVPGPTAMTVAVLGESDTRWGAAAVVARLAELAASDELVVVYGADRPAPPQRDADVLVTGLRERLPRHRVVTVPVVLRAGSLDRYTPIFSEFVESGAVTIAVTPIVDLRDVAAQLSSRLRADRVLRVSFSLAAGADLQEVWNR